MKRRMQTLITSLLAVLCTLTLLPVEFAAEIPADGVYEFTGAEFTGAGESVEGVLVRAVPDQELCLLCLGDRIIRAGDVLPKGELSRLALRPVRDASAEADIEYQPIVQGRLGERCVCTMMIRSTKNEPPTALDGAYETYKNVAYEGVLRAIDPEGDALTYQIVEQPRKGTVELADGGAFVYTPKKNKVGDDRFTFTATDLAGNVSEPAAVSVRILQPLDTQTFDDLSPETQFPAMWLREQGLFGGTRVGDALCFGPEQTVSRGEFLTMAMRLSGIEPEIGLCSAVFADWDDAPAWMQRYLYSALRRGLVSGCATENGLVFLPNQPIKADEAAAILTRCFGLHTAQEVGSFDAQGDDAEANMPGAESLADMPGAESLADVPVWAEASVRALYSAGLTLPCAAEAPLTRMQVARLLLAVSTVGE